jgi:hypothetical protein
MFQSFIKSLEHNALTRETAIPFAVVRSSHPVHGQDVFKKGSQRAGGEGNGMF